jgi:hypothetical protein
VTPSTVQARRVESALKQRGTYADTQAWLDAVVASIGDDARLEDDSLAWLQQELRGHYGDEYLKIGEDYDAHIAFWRTLAERFPGQPKLRGLYADTLLISGRDQSLALSEFMKAVAADPTLYPEFAGDFWGPAEAAGGDRWFEFRLAELRYAAATDDPEHAADLTTALLRDFGRSPEVAARIKACAHPPRPRGQ